ncbi:MAG: aminotransferase class I/II-fold pyridoxal phosphate-dependent enzyme [Solirubrobacterales bacterium]
MKTPLYDALLAYHSRMRVQLHMPGHHGGDAFGDAYSPLAGTGKIDMTEVAGLDDLHSATGVIGESMHLAARTWRAGESLFLVNGATSGIHTLLLAIGENKILIPRNSHLSVLGGLVLSGGMPVSLPCIQDPELGIALAVDPEAVWEAVDAEPNLAAMLLVSPAYFGTVGDTSEIASILHARNIPLLVDEAHGAHFAFHPEAPEQALDAGADAVVHGLHKTLPVLTQAGMLHLSNNAERLDPVRVRAVHRLLTTTSPSYPLMASIDVGRALMEESGEELLDAAFSHSRRFKREMNERPGSRCRVCEFGNVPGVVGVDPLKIVLDCRDIGFSGIDLAAALSDRFGIEVELAARDYLLAMFSPFSPQEDWERLGKALDRVIVEPSHSKRQPPVQLPPIPKQVVTPRRAFLGSAKTVMIEESVNRVSCEIVAAYPPGIPCLIPGEAITAEIVDYLKELRDRRTPVHGPADRTLRSIRVLDGAPLE